MDKEEILEKSRKENDGKDEHDQYIDGKGASFSVIVMILLWLFLKNCVPVDSLSQYAMGVVVMTTSLANFASRTIKNRTKTSIFFSVAFLVLAIAYWFLFLKDGLKVF